MAGRQTGRRGSMSEQALSRKYSVYIRNKVDQLLKVMGTFPLRPEELDDETLLDLDPVGIIAESFKQILDHLKETNQELRLAHESLQAIFDATGVGISIIDRDFRIQNCNEKQRNLLVDAGVGDVTGRFCHEVYCNKPSPDIDCPAIDTMETGRTVIVREAAKKGKHFQLVTTPLRDNAGAIVGVIEVLLDISDTKRARDAEKEQRGFYLTEKSKLATILQSLSEGLFVADSRGAIVSFNNAAADITGYREAEVLGLDRARFFALLCPDRPGLPDERGAASREIAVLSKDGRRLTLALSSVSLQDGGGKYIGQVYTFRDISGEKQRQENHYRTEKLVALGQLSAGIAHELNTPLGSILGYARLMMKEDGRSDEERERLEIIAEQAIRGSAIIKRLLNFARQSAPELGDTDLNEVITGSLKMLAEEIEKRRVAVVTELHALPLLRADKRQLEQVIINMMLNALQAIGKGGMVRIGTSRNGQSVSIVIRDSGPGIPPGLRTRIFDPFFTTKPIGEGTGLGLSICTGIVSGHGGTIQVESEEGSGASFLITLPVQRTEGRTL